MKWRPSRQPIDEFRLHHLPGVMAIEADSDSPWDKGDFYAYLDPQYDWKRGLVYMSGDAVVGFAMFDCSVDRIDLLNLAVHPSVRREGIATALLGRVLSHLCGDRQRVLVTVSERNLPAQLLLKSRGFRFDRRPLRNHYPDGDGYRFRFDARAVEPANRISAWMEG